MIKKAVLFTALILLFTGFVCADSFRTVGAGEVIIVGKVTVHPPKNLEFYAKSWGITDFSKPDMYVIFDDSYKESYWSGFLMGGFLGDIKKHTNKAYYFYEGEEYFLSRRNLKKQNLKAKSPIKYCFFSNESFSVYLPLEFASTIPKGKKYVYVGNYEYFLEGNDFHVEKILVSYNHDKAQKALDQKIGKHVDLYQAENIFD